MLARQLTVALLTGLVGLSACAHGAKSRERTSVSAVTNEQVDQQAGEQEKHRMHYTEVSNDEALGRTHAQPAEPEDARSAQASPTATGAVPEPAASGTAADAQACELAVYFATDSAALDVSSQQRLDRVAECMKRHEVDHATIVGATDPRGSEQHNRELGLERARVVADYLQTRGVPRREIRVRSQGEVASAGAREAWPIDRQVDVNVKP